MTKENSDAALGLVRKIVEQLDEFEFHLIGYLEKVRRTLTESDPT